MASCSGRGSSNNTFELILYVDQASQNATNNTTIVNWRLELASLGSYSFSQWGSTCNVNIDGTTVYNEYSQKSLSSGQRITIASGSHTISHNSDGSKSINFNASYTQGNSTYYTPGNISCSGSMTLTTIPRASEPTLSESPFNIGEAITIYTNRKSDNFTHKIYFNYGTNKILIASNVTTSYKFNTSEYSDIFFNAIPNSTSGFGNFSVETYNGNSHIGTKSVNFEALVPENIIPNIDSIILEEGEEKIKGDIKLFVQNISKLKVSIKASGNKGSTIKLYKVEVNDAIYNSANFITDVLKKDGRLSVYISVTDTRGRIVSTIQEVFVYKYFFPFLDSSEFERTNEQGKEEEEGTYIHSKIKAWFSALNLYNYITLKVYYKKKNESEYTFFNEFIFSTSLPIPTDLPVQETTFEPDVLIPNADVDSSYSVKIIYYDKISELMNTSFERIFEMPSAFTTLDFLFNGKGIAAGKVSEEECFDMGFLMLFSNGIKAKTVSEGDANDYKYGGFYYFTSNNLNIPGECFLFIIGNKIKTIQIAFLLEKDEIYRRNFINENWSEWKLR